MTEVPTSGPFAFRNKPVNEDPPSERDIATSYSLQTFLQERGSYLTPEDNAKRGDVLFKLNELVNQFVRDVYKTRYNDITNSESVFGKLVTYGSFRLGISNADSDIDALCIAPRYVTRVDFFSTFYKMLLNHTLVTDLTKIENARVPIMTMKFQGIYVDLAFAQIAAGEINPDMNENDLENDSILNDVDQRTILSLNGPRVSNMIQKLVPNVEHFRTLLRFVRIWAKERGLYGNVYGYLGGVNLALLCAYICQRYPTAYPAMLVLMFFQDLCYHTWSEPIYINTPNTGPQPSWEPDRRECMPIITPAYPSMNSLKNATHSSKQRLTTEFKRGYHMTRKVILEGYLWDVVVTPSNFFMQYRRYLQVTAWSNNKDNFNKWIGIVESRILKLTNLEGLLFINWAFIWPSYFEHPDEEGHQNAGHFFIALEYNIPKEESVEKRIDISDVCQKFIDTLYKHIIGKTDENGLSMKVRSRSMLPDFVFPNGRPEPKHKTITTTTV
ncbi:hypothetical protein M9Y10_001838 [Tritrichomonas musculus]|uniref:Poly(A) polymerase n=1 Tax=Tritrichomonas musculus TaxID=1915356 RepID=A0ABR2L9T0_9EUKA